MAWKPQPGDDLWVRRAVALWTAALASLVLLAPLTLAPAGNRAGNSGKSEPLVVGEPIESAKRDKLFSAIDKHALAASMDVEKSIASLASYLVRPAKTDVGKARAIFRWVTDRIAYDADGLFTKNYGDNTVDAVLKNRKCVCEGYARIYVALGKAAGLEVKQVRGVARGIGLAKEDAESTVTHSWCAVKLDDKWFLMDPTWGAGYLRDKQFVKTFNEFHFEAPPDQLIFTHFPNEEKWQLLSKPLTRAEFDKQPRFSAQFFKLGFTGEQARKAMTQESFKEPVKVYALPGSRTLVKEAPVSKSLKQGKKYAFRIQSSDYQVLCFINAGNFTFFERRNNSNFFEGSIVPARGPLKISGNPQLSKSGKFESILEYVVE